MTAAKFARLLLLLSPALGLIAAVIWYIAKPVYVPTQSGEPVETRTDAGGKLVVLVVFDQLRGDYLSRWDKLFDKDGFEKLKREGVWYSHVQIPYACTSTAPGHASLVTGVPPSVHGIIENKWFDRTRGKVVAAGTTDEPFERIPHLEAANREKWPALAPTRLLAPTVGDALKAQTKTGRVYSLSLKDRAAVLMGGKEPNAMYCFDSSAGEFHTSSFYRNKIHDWADAFDRNRVAYRWAGKTWDRLKPAVLYDEFGRDDTKGEGGRIFKDRFTFPYPLPTANDKTANYFDALEYSAFGNELLWEFAKVAIEGDRIGRNGTSDLLCVSFSSNDLIGHAFGPDSHEVLDLTLRSDQLIGAMLTFLDEKVGKDRYSLVVTSDHGISPLPEIAAKTQLTARRIAAGDLIAGLDEALDKTFGLADGNPGQWVEKDAPSRDVHPWIYLNRRTVDAVGVPMIEVEKYAANWLRERPNVLTAHSRTELMNGSFTSPEQQRFGKMAQLAFHPDRSGELYVITQPYVQVMGAFSLGVDHGSPHDYDRHVPVLAYGKAVPKLGEQKEEKSSLLVAPLLAQLLGIKPPEGSLELPDVLKIPGEK